ncbi:hypothetical protein [Rufibacter immobilis]|uniref:hypothetical protein n=1 Tax=Rufibacter immobilis TaxID=1348778 RepID=UPI0011CEC813|nr:hypothetical protein [Rufibacter immobilis]
MRKRNTILLAVFAVVFSSCQQQKSYSFKDIPCPYAETPTWSGGKISSLDNLAGKAKVNALREEEVRPHLQALPTIHLQGPL